MGKIEEQKEIEGVDYELVVIDDEGNTEKQYLIDGIPVAGVTAEQYRLRKYENIDIEGIDYIIKTDESGDSYRESTVITPGGVTAVTEMADGDPDMVEYYINKKIENREKFKYKPKVIDEYKDILNSNNLPKEGIDYRVDSTYAENELFTKRIPLVNGFEIDSLEAEDARIEEQKKLREAYIEKRKKQSQGVNNGLFGKEGKDWEWRDIGGKIVRKAIGTADNEKDWSERAFENTRGKNGVEGIDYVNHVDLMGIYYKDSYYKDTFRSEFDKKINDSKEKFIVKNEEDKIKAKKIADEKAKKQAIIDKENAKKKAVADKEKAEKKAVADKIKAEKEAAINKAKADAIQLENEKLDAAREQFKDEEITAEKSAIVYNTDGTIKNYETTITTDSGRTQVITSDKPGKLKTAFGDTFLTIEDSPDSYKIDKGNLETKKLLDKDIAKNKFEELINLSKTNNGLSTDEIKLAEKVYDVRKFQLKQDKLLAEKTYEKSDKDSDEEKIENIESDENSLKNIFDYEILLREARKRFDAQGVTANKLYKQAKEDLESGEITSEEFEKRENAYNQWDKIHDKQGGAISSRESARDNAAKYDANPSTIKKMGSETMRLYMKAFGSDDEFLNDYLTNQSVSADENEIVAENETIEEIKPLKSLDKKNTRKSSSNSIGVNKTSNQVVDENEIVNDFTNQSTYTDNSYYDEQIAEIDEQLNSMNTAEEFTPDLSSLENKDKYGNLISMAADLGTGYMGLKGAMEEVPEYQKGEMFNAYTDEAYRQRNMGLSSEEMGLRKQLAERGFGYDVKNIRRLSGGSAGVALGNLGRASGTLQNRYAQMAAEDSATRRLNQQRFDRAALSDENFNRRKFEDSFKTTMLNKEMGAQLVRDKIKNMNERADYEKQFGEGSMYNELSKEMLKGKQYNNQALKMSQEYQKEKQESFLKDRRKRLEDNKTK